MKTAPRLLFILAALLLAGPSASAETQRVTDDGSLRRALRDLEAGDVVEIAMAPGVASLNLATAVAVVLYRWRLRAPIEDR